MRNIDADELVRKQGGTWRDEGATEPVKQEPDVPPDEAQYLCCDEDHHGAGRPLEQGIPVTDGSTIQPAQEGEHHEEGEGSNDLVQHVPLTDELTGDGIPDPTD